MKRYTVLRSFNEHIRLRGQQLCVKSSPEEPEVQAAQEPALLMYVVEFQLWSVLWVCKMDIFHPWVYCAPGPKPTGRIALVRPSR